MQIDIDSQSGLLRNGRIFHLYFFKFFPFIYSQSSFSRSYVHTLMILLVFCFYNPESVKFVYKRAQKLIKSSSSIWHHIASRDAGGGGAGGARAPPSFGISVNPIRIKGADYAHHITTVPPHLFG